MTSICPACGAVRHVVQISPMEIRRESDLREDFVNQRLEHRPEQEERMDLTEFMHGGNGRLVACARCGLLLREDERAADYRHDIYDPDLMTHLYPRYLRAFEKKKSLYQPLLGEHAEVLEIGSHLGAFLQAAEKWDWRPTGLDIGQATSEFARRRGLSVKRLSMEEYSPRLKRPDAIFIWNCFEQLPDPGTTLRQSHRLMEKNGLLIVRVPSARFYQRTRKTLSAPAVRLLGYNNLLGFPYLYGYTFSTLAQILKRHGFMPIAGHNSSVLTPPYPDMPGWVKEEWREVRRADRVSDAAEGPWIEMVGRRM